LTARLRLGTLVSIMSPEHCARNSSSSSSWQRSVTAVLLVVAALLALSVAILTHHAA